MPLLNWQFPSKMNNWTQNKTIQILLALLLAAIWGYNAYQLLYAPVSDEPFSQPNFQNFKTLVALDSLEGAYSANFRDPFLPYRYLPDSIKVKKDSLGAQNTLQPFMPQNFPEYIPPPAYRLSGIVGEIAILEDQQTGESHLKRRGEMVGNYRVVMVAHSLVKLRQKNKEFVLVVE